MKWFKHMTDASSGETLSQVFDEYGFAGLGMYWTIVEVVAKHWKEGEPALKRSPKAWRKLTGIYPKTFVELLRFLGGISEVSATFDEKAIKVCIPKLSKIRDEYSRKSGQSPDKVAPEAEEDKEVKTQDTGCAGDGVSALGKGKDGSPIAFLVPLADGSTANLTEKTLQEWEKNYRFIDVRGKVADLVAWYAEGGGKAKRFDKKGWFFGFAGILSKASAKAKAEMAKRDPNFDPNDPDGSKAAAKRAEETRQMIADLTKRTSFAGEVQ